MLYNTAGQLVETLPKHTTFDQSRPAMRQLFVADCMYAISSGAFDGCFIDRANYATNVVQDGGNATGYWDLPTALRMQAAMRQLFDELMAAAGQDHVILAKEGVRVEPMDWQQVGRRFG